MRPDSAIIWNLSQIAGMRADGGPLCRQIWWSEGRGTRAFDRERQRQTEDLSMTFMRKRSGPAGLATGAALAAALLGWAPAFAQDAEAPAAEAPAAEAAPGTAAPTSVPQPDWTKVCGTVNEKEECHTERRRLAATGQPIAQFMIIEREGKRLVQIAVPPVALIQPGVQIKIDDGEPTGVKYVVCTPNE